MNKKARVDALERVKEGSFRGAYVWQAPGQTRDEALAAADLPADAPNPTFSWKDPQ